MIDIRLTENRLEVKGHAGYAEAGKDIVAGQWVIHFCESGSEESL